MAHLRSLPKCQDCKTRVATQELRGWRNELLGVFCNRCATRALRKREALEAEWAKAGG